MKVEPSVKRIITHHLELNGDEMDHLIEILRNTDIVDVTSTLIAETFGRVLLENLESARERAYVM